MNNKVTEKIKFDNKVSIILDEDIPYHIAINTITHLSISFGAHNNRIIGQKLIDSSNIKHSSLSLYPVTILSAKQNAIKSTLDRARELNTFITDFPKVAYEIWTDEELSNTISKMNYAKLDYWGILLFDKRKVVNKLTGRFKLYKI